MGSIQHLENQEAIAKMKELAEDIQICMFCTNIRELPFEARPMATQSVDEKGNIWFISAVESNKNDDIKTNDQVQLLYAKPSDTKFLSIYGYAEISKDREKIDELWSPLAKAWFPEGKDDPRITVIRVMPEHAHYWDTQHGKMVTLFKIAVSAITGSQKDGGVEGILSI